MKSRVSDNMKREVRAPGRMQIKRLRVKFCQSRVLVECLGPPIQRKPDKSRCGAACPGVGGPTGDYFHSLPARNLFIEGDVRAECAEIEERAKALWGLLYPPFHPP